MAELTTDAIMSRLGKKRSCSTHEYRLDGAPEGSWSEFATRAARDIETKWSLSTDAARHLVQRYGRHAATVAEYVHANPQQVLAGEPDLVGEFYYQRDHEMAVRPEDFLLRRTRLGLFSAALLANPPSALVSITRHSS